MDQISFHIEHLSKSYPLMGGKNILALHNVTFDARDNEFISIIGPSGCGKSTLIQLLAGLIEPTGGEILEAGGAVVGTTGNRGVVFQQYNLFPWLTVEENIGFGLKIVGRSEKERKEIIARYIGLVGLKGFDGAYPKELSGGMQQRVALTRTLATNPKILLMDEPFTALDVQTKRRMQDLLLDIWQQEPRTVIFVTHDVEEAVLLSDTIYIMTPNPGTIQEKITINLPRPRELNIEFSHDFLQLRQRIQHAIVKTTLNFTKPTVVIYKKQWPFASTQS